MKGKHFKIKRLVFSVVLLAIVYTPAFGIGHGLEKISLPYVKDYLPLFLLSLVTGILAVASGIGGDILYFPMLTLFLSYSLTLVKSLSFFIMFFSSLITGPLLIKQRFVPPKAYLPLTLAAIIGTIVGSLMGREMELHHLQIITGLIICYIALFLWIQKNNPNPRSFITSGNKVSYIGLFLNGIITGVSGMGTGYLGIYLLTSNMNFTITGAVTTLKIAGGAKGLMGLFAYPLKLSYFSAASFSFIGVLLGSLTGLMLLPYSHLCQKIRTSSLLLLLLSALKLLFKGMFPSLLGLWLIN